MAFGRDHQDGEHLDLLKNVEKPVICMHTNLQYFLGVRGCGTAHEGDRPFFVHVFVSMFSCFPPHLGRFTPARPECLFGVGGFRWVQLFSPIWLVFNGRISLVKDLCCSQTALKWVPRIWAWGPHLIPQQFYPLEFMKFDK